MQLFYILEWRVFTFLLGYILVIIKVYSQNSVTYVIIDFYKSIYHPKHNRLTNILVLKLENIIFSFQSWRRRS